MKDYLSPNMTDEELSSVSVLALAHIGDGIYELLIRTWLCTRGRHTSNSLHRTTVRHVCAKAQSEASKKLLPHLTDTEQAIFRRGRNAKVNTVPKNASLADYHAATGLETLFGWLYLKGEKARINQLFAIITEEKNAA